MARLFLPAGTNYILNPRLKSSSPPWVEGLSQYLTGTGVACNYETAQTVTLDSSLGVWVHSFQGTFTAGTGGLGAVSFFDTTDGTFAPADPLTGSFYAHSFSTSGAGTATLYVTSRTSPGVAVDTASAAISKSTVLTRYSGTVASCSATTARARWAVAVANCANGDTFNLTYSRPLVEKSAVLTPYYSGSSTDSLNASTYAWSGTTDASTSTRAVSNLQFTTGIPSNLMNTQATIAARVVPLWAGNDSIDHNIVDLRHATSAFVMQKINSNTWRAQFWDGSGTSNCISTALNFSAGTTHSLVCRLLTGASGTIDLIHDGTTVTQTAHTRVAAGAATSILVGQISGGTYIATSYVGPVIVSPVRKPDAWVTAVDAYLRGSSISIDYIKKNFMAPGDALFTGRQSDGSNIYVKGS